MTLKERIRAGGIIAITLLAIGFVFLGNQRPVHASVVPPNLGQQIVCFVFTNLNGFGPPIPVLSADGCQATSTPSGTGRLEVIKIVSGTSTPSSDFTIHVKSAGTDVADPQPGSSSGITYIGLNPGAYAVSEESNTAGINLGDYTSTFSGACPAGVAVVGVSDTPVVCTITNTYKGSGGGGGGTQYGGLIIKKVIVGNADANPSMFSFTINSGSATAFNSNGENDMTLAVGAYNVSEVAVSNYTPSYSNCVAAVVALGATTTCTITNTFSNGGGGGTTSDLSVVKTASVATSTVGGAVTYTITVSNAGPASASGVSVSDILPSGVTYVSDDSGGLYATSTGVWTVGTIGNGGTAVLHIVTTVNAGAAGTTVTNSAAASDSNGDPNSGNNTGTVSITVAGSNGGSATTSDVSVGKSVDNATPNIGATLTYTITASDTGVDATGVVIQDVLPAGLTFVSTSTSDTVGVYNSTTGNWTIGNLSSTTPAILHIIATVNNNLGNGTVITNTATVTGGDTASTTTSVGNNSSNAPVTVTIPSTNPGGGGGPGPSGGGNGPIVGSYGGGGNGPIVPNGQVLGNATTTLPTACSQFLTGFIRTGQQNDPSQVYRLQAFLDAFDGAQLKLTGVYDAATVAATRTFQKHYATEVLTPWGITSPTGYVYLTTRKTINTIYCHYTMNFPLTAAEQAIITASRTRSQSDGTPSTVKPTTPVKTTKPSTGSTGLPTQNPLQTGSTGNTPTIPLGTTTSDGGVIDFFKHLFGH